jgi:elongation factor Ts
MVNINKIKELRDETGVSIGECKKALEKAGGDTKKAKNILKELGRDIAKKRGGREAREGIIDSYIHAGKKVGVLLELDCESDFVARSDDFKKLAHELCLQIAAINPDDNPLLEQLWIRDQTKKIKDLIDEYIAKFGEKIIIKRFTRYEL